MEGHSNLDPYIIETKVGKPLYGKVSVLNHIRCPDMFSARVRGLSNNKRPGPDGIPNELIKHLPDKLHLAIHKLSSTELERVINYIAAQEGERTALEQVQTNSIGQHIVQVVNRGCT